ncbi:DgyrCDS3714 [Dimorphilus gyrociliatus]|uniref:DgyrCDS3714 n=1 Tax=Dimorphilus gyrociliatus TaxID=2664684 RepID=A0A7I8VE63_9ANNE|nr:DgyrCDS3714 [Dimorphilus gyrociliatus]
MLKGISFHVKRRIGTASKLVTTFNQRPKKKFSLNYPKSSVGLFNISELNHPDGFKVLLDRAQTRVRELFDEAIAQDRKRILVEIFDDMSNTICKVADMSDFVRTCHPNLKMAGAADEAFMNLSRLVEEYGLNTNKTIHEALKYTLKNQDVKELTDVDRRVGWMFINDYEQSLVADDKKAKEFVDITNEILRLGTKFSQNCAIPVGIPTEFLPKDLLNVFPKNGGHSLITHQYSFHHNEKVRETGYKLFYGEEKSQLEILDQLLLARYKLAEVTGFKSYAERSLNQTMAQTPEFVDSFLQSLSEKIRPKVDEEMREVSKAHEKNFGSKEVQVWNTHYLCNQISQMKNNFKASEIAPYLSLGTCMEGLNNLIQEIFRISLNVEDTEPGEIWHEDIKKIVVRDEENNDLGTIYCDFFERQGKLPQECHFTICGGKEMADGTYQNPIIVVHLNLPKSSYPCLLNTQSLENLWHEFGHAIHSMLGRTYYQHTTGTRCPSDFAEVPSIFLEKFASDPRVQKSFAKHYETGEELSEKKILNLNKSKKMFSAMETNEQLFYSMIDQAYHGPHPLKGSTTQILQNIMKTYYHLPFVKNTAWQGRFSHLNGYGAKYYAYILSRAVAESIWQEAFEKDPFSRTAGERYKKKILVHGGSRPPYDLVKDMLGSNINSSTLVNSLSRSFER